MNYISGMYKDASLKEFSAIAKSLGQRFAKREISPVLKSETKIVAFPKNSPQQYGHRIEPQHQEFVATPKKSGPTPAQEASEATIRQHSMDLMMMGK
jgi:hypothetical protein